MAYLSFLTSWERAFSMAFSKESKIKCRGSVISLFWPQNPQAQTITETSDIDTDFGIRHRQSGHRHYRRTDSDCTTQYKIQDSAAYAVPPPSSLPFSFLGKIGGATKTKQIIFSCCPNEEKNNDLWSEITGPWGHRATNRTQLPDSLPQKRFEMYLHSVCLLFWRVSSKDFIET